MSNNKKQPDQLLIDSMAMRYRHDFGILTFEEQQSIRVTMTQLWEEVVGLGFYKPTHKTMSNNKQYTEKEDETPFATYHSALIEWGSGELEDVPTCWLERFKQDLEKEINLRKNTHENNNRI